MTWQVYVIANCKLYSNGSSFIRISIHALNKCIGSSNKRLKPVKCKDSKLFMISVVMKKLHTNTLITKVTLSKNKYSLNLFTRASILYYKSFYSIPCPPHQFITLSR